MFALQIQTVRSCLRLEEVLVGKKSSHSRWRGGRKGFFPCCPKKLEVFDHSYMKQIALHKVEVYFFHVEDQVRSVWENFQINWNYTTHGKKLVSKKK